jgi:hypothetical protein
MDYRLISETVAQLRAELQLIGAENRKYLGRKNHREYEIMQHRRREDRILEIKAELETLLKRKIA